ncbi:MAG TPA: RNA polymerase sigma-54 factor, partial [Candidatus Latescibacteria bacterium]|nr:RNA polymerase sigma-54 factor [Candidatus Latescibacterota bacterium]
SSESERQYVRQKLNDAKWVVDSIEQRRSTMMKVMTYIVEAQRGFLDNGLAYLRPMILQNVADHVGVHAATVSRVTQGKYVQTPRGLFKLKFFFDGMIPKEGGGEMATKSVKDRLARLIREEDATAPLSDDGLMKILQSEGMQIKRRTVAKYRNQIGIPVARMRKQI